MGNERGYEGLASSSFSTSEKENPTRTKKTSKVTRPQQYKGGSDGSSRRRWKSVRKGGPGSTRSRVRKKMEGSRIFIKLAVSDGEAHKASETQSKDVGKNYQPQQQHPGNLHSDSSGSEEDIVKSEKKKKNPGGGGVCARYRKMGERESAKTSPAERCEKLWADHKHRGSKEGGQRLFFETLTSYKAQINPSRLKTRNPGTEPCI